MRRITAVAVAVALVACCLSVVSLASGAPSGSSSLRSPVASSSSSSGRVGVRSGAFPSSVPFANGQSLLVPDSLCHRPQACVQDAFDSRVWYFACWSGILRWSGQVSDTMTIVEGAQGSFAQPAIQTLDQDRKTGDLYYITQKDATLYSVDPLGAHPPVVVVASAQCTALSTGVGYGEVWFQCAGMTVVQHLDTATGLITSIPMGDASSALAAMVFDYELGELYLMTYESDLYVYNISTPTRPPTVLLTKAQCADPTLMVRRLPGTSILLAGCSSNSLTAFDLAANTSRVLLFESDVCAVADTNVGIAWDDVRQTAFVGCSSGTAVAVAIQWLNSPDVVLTSIVNAEQCVAAIGVRRSREDSSVYVLCAVGVTVTNGIGYVQVVAGRTCSISTFVLVGSDGTTYANCLANEPILAIRGGLVRPVIGRDECLQMNSMALDRRNSTLYFTCSPGVLRLAYWCPVQHQIVVVSLWSAPDVGLTPQYQLTFSGSSLFLARTYERLLRWNGTDVEEVLPAAADVAFVGSIAHLAQLYYQPQPPAVGLFQVRLDVPMGERTPTTLSNLTGCTSTRWSIDEPRGRLFVVCNPTPSARTQTDSPILFFDLSSHTQSAFVLTNYTRCRAPLYDPSDASLLLFVCASSELRYGTTEEPRELVTWSLTSRAIVDVLQVCPGAEADIQLLAMDFDPLTRAQTLSCSAIDIITSEIVVLSHAFSCSPGYEWSDGQCSPCAVGTARGRIDFFNATRAITGCLPCEPGFIAPLIGSESCQACPVGTFDDDSLTQVCSKCEPGFSQSQEAQWGCQPCSPGRYSPVAGSPVCLPCANGTYADQEQSPICSFCAPGRSAAGEGATVCTQCEVGTFSSDIGYSSCTPCGPGTYTNARGRSFCTPCDRNSFSNVTGLNTTCPFCPSGTEQPGFSGLDCLACPSGSVSVAGGPCSQCGSNTYASDRGDICLSCTGANQVGLVCTDGLVSVANGYWAYLEFSPTVGRMVYRTTECPAGYCFEHALPVGNTTTSIVVRQPLQMLHRAGVDARASVSLVGDPSDPPPADAFLTVDIVWCEFPRLNDVTNTICAKCVDDFIAWGQRCVPCTGPNYFLICLIAVVCFLLVGFLMRSNSSEGQLTVLVFYVQTAALELGPISGWIDWLQWFNFGASSTNSCIAPLSALEQMVLTMTAPFALLLTLAIMLAVHAVLYQCIGRQAARPDASRLYHFVHSFASRPSTSRYIACVTAIAIFCYTSITVTVVQALHCVEVASGVSLLFNSPSIDCASSAYSRMKPVFYLCLAVYVIGFPVGMLVFLWRKRHHIADPTKVDPEPTLAQEEQGIDDPSLIIADELNDEAAEMSPMGGAAKSTEHSQGMSEMSPHVRHRFDGGRVGSVDGGSTIDDSLISFSLGPSECEVVTAARKRTRFDMRYGHFFRMYRPSAWYWQPLQMLRRFAYALAAVLLLQNVTIKYAVYGMLGLASLTMHSVAQPFRSHRLNKIDSLCLLFLVCLSYVLICANPPYPFAIQFLMFLLTVPLSLLLLGLTARNIFRMIRAKYWADGGGGRTDTADADGHLTAASDSSSLNSSLAPDASFASSISARAPERGAPRNRGGKILNSSRTATAAAGSGAASGGGGVHRGTLREKLLVDSLITSHPDDFSLDDRSGNNSTGGPAAEEEERKAPAVRPRSMPSSVLALEVKEQNEEDEPAPTPAQYYR